MNPLITIILDHLFPNPKIPLNHSNPFTLLIAVLLSAQCTDVKVNKVTPLLFSTGNTPGDVLKIGLEEIEQIIKPLGLYRIKAKNIIKICQILLERYNGEVPTTFKKLESLPGVGHKTASCIMSQAFNIPAFAVDTHIHRLAKRWNLTKGKTVEHTEVDLKKCFRKKDWSCRHLQIIYYARAYCPARGHKIEKCPICLALSI